MSVKSHNFFLFDDFFNADNYPSKEQNLIVGLKVQDWLSASLPPGLDFYPPSQLFSFIGAIAFLLLLKAIYSNISCRLPSLREFLSVYLSLNAVLNPHWEIELQLAFYV